MTARINQGQIVAAVSFAPPNSLPTINQGMLVIAARMYEIRKPVEIGPAVNTPNKPFKSVPGFLKG